MLATVSSLLRLLIWETDKVFALVFVRVYILNAGIRRPLAISNNEMTFPGFQLHWGVISQRCFNSFLLLWKCGRDYDLSLSLCPQRRLSEE